MNIMEKFSRKFNTFEHRKLFTEKSEKRFPGKSRQSFVRKFPKKKKLKLS